MPTRLLLAVLILVGQMPFRVCTCAAVECSEPTRHQTPRTAEQPPATKGCGCSHRHSPVWHAPEEIPATAQRDPAEGDRHQPDCPAVNPRPVLKSALPVPVETGDAETAPAACPLSFPFPMAVLGLTAPARHPPGNPPVPLFLSLCVLRN